MLKKMLEPYDLKDMKVYSIKEMRPSYPLSPQITAGTWTSSAALWSRAKMGLCVTI